MKRDPSLPLVLGLALLLVAGAAWWRTSTSHSAGGELPQSAGTPDRFPLPVIGERSATAGERHQAITSIKSQLAAFARDDFAEAEKYQSAQLRKSFPSTQAFASMMRRGYPNFLRARQVVYGKARCERAGNRLTISVTLTDTHGTKAQAVYTMFKEAGIYRVQGVLGGVPALQRGLRV